MAIKKASIGMFKYGRFVKRHSVSLKRNLMKDIIASVNAKLIEYLSYKGVKMAKNDRCKACFFKSYEEKKFGNKAIWLGFARKNPNRGENQ